MNKIIHIFGDSIAYGDFDIENGGWINRLKDFLDVNNYNIDVRNLGIQGDTTEGLLKRFYTESKIIEKTDIIIFAIGINDLKHIGKNTQSIISLEKFQENLEKLIIQAKKITKDIILLGLTNIDETKTLPVFWNGENTNIFFNKSDVNLYNSKIKDISQENNLKFIDMLDLLENEDLEDGLHPNSRGHQKIFNKVKDFLI
ncbi:SGNH/GDSL hydrolase family protein [Candidatus Woesearchaeota archaeon]|jgi:lysophospholipase L1-like esterase|nr:SGNH/GDSL hydrolase family protein [Candidatus Woesearchaeota archaeon]MBT4733122.1 SGNH/GDSL hydrolase family protein [Candidatus Woesearchaeota archaeon]MBT7555547.1 SGNH/GDSL hydrolase family protein [Candidatus Woesearchaeota archaeon]